MSSSSIMCSRQSQQQQCIHRLSLALQLLVCVLLPLSVFAAPATTPSLSLAVITPHSGNVYLSEQGARVDFILDLAVSDLNAGRLIMPGSSTPLQLDAAGTQLQLIHTDTGGRAEGAVTALRNVLDANTTDSSVVGVIGGIDVNMVQALSFYSSIRQLPLLNAWCGHPSLGDTVDHPYHNRLIPNSESIAIGLFRMMQRAKWYKATIIALDDDESLSINDFLMNLIAASGLEGSTAPEFILANNTQSSATSNFDVRNYIIPSTRMDFEVLNRTQVAVNYALGESNDAYIFVLIGASTGSYPTSIQSRVMQYILTNARERLVVGPGLNLFGAYLTQQWIGTGFCDERSGIIEGLQTTYPDPNDQLYVGLVCVGTLAPRVTASPVVTPVPEAIAFQNRLRSLNATLFPATYTIQTYEVQSYNSVIFAAAAIRTMLTDSTFSNSQNNGTTLQNAINYMLRTQPNALIGIDGTPMTFTTPVDATPTTAAINCDSTQPLGIYNWNPSKGDFWITGFLDIDRHTLNYSQTDFIFADGSNEYPKDRANVYVTGDALPPHTFDAKMVVLGFCVSVIGAWTGMILFEQAISTLTLNQRVKTLCWNSLAAVAFGVCNIWCVYVLHLAALQTPARFMRVEQGPFFGAMVMTLIPLTLVFMFNTKQEVDGRKKNGIVGSGGAYKRTSKGSGTGSNKGSTSGNRPSRSTSASASWATEFRRVRDGLVADIHEIKAHATVANALTSAVFAAMSVSVLALLANSVYSEAVPAYSIGAWPGAAIVLWVISWPCMLIAFHLLRSRLRFIVPFILAAVNVAAAQMVLSPSTTKWTFQDCYSAGGTTTTATSTLTFVRAAAIDYSYIPRADATVPVDTNASIAIVATCIAALLAFMVINIAALRNAKQALDRVLSKLRSQVRGIEVDIAREVEQREELIEHGRYYRRHVEVINLCRPVYRPHAVALAMAEPKAMPESIEEALALQTNIIGGAEKDAATAGAAAKSAKELAAERERKRLLEKEAMRLVSPKGGRHSCSQQSQQAAAAAAAAAAGGGAVKIQHPHQPHENESKEQKEREKEFSGASMSRSATVTGGGESGKRSGGTGTPARTNFLQPRRATNKSAAMKLVTGADFNIFHCAKDEQQLLALLKEVTEMKMNESLANLAAPAAELSDGGALEPIVSLHSRLLSDIRLPQIFSSPSTVELLKDVLSKQLSPENIAVWLDILRYRSLQSAAARRTVAEELYSSFIQNGATFEVNLSASMKDAIGAKILGTQTVTSPASPHHGGNGSSGGSGSFNLPSPTRASAYVPKLTQDLFDTVEAEIYRLVGTNNISEILSNPWSLKLCALLLQHPLFQLKSAKPIVNATGVSVSSSLIQGYHVGGTGATADRAGNERLGSIGVPSFVKGTNGSTGVGTAPAATATATGEAAASNANARRAPSVSSAVSQLSKKGIDPPSSVAAGGNANEEANAVAGIAQGLRASSLSATHRSGASSSVVGESGGEGVDAEIARLVNPTGNTNKRLQPSSRGAAAVPRQQQQQHIRSPSLTRPTTADALSPASPSISASTGAMTHSSPRPS